MGSPTFSEIKGERARDYLWARAKRHDDGTYYFENALDAKLYEVMVEASKIPGRFYRNPGPCDIMSIALETKEPLAVEGVYVLMSRTRGLSHSAKKRGSA